MVQEVRHFNPKMETSGFAPQKFFLVCSYSLCCLPHAQGVLESVPAFILSVSATCNH